MYGTRSSRPCAIESLSAYMSSSSGSVERTSRNWRPPNSSVESIRLVRSDQGHFHVVPRPLAHEVHGNNRGSGDRLFQRSNNLRKRFLEDGFREPDAGVIRTERVSRLRGIREFIIGERRAVTDSVCRPGFAAEIHQRQEQRRIDAAAQKQADGNVTDELPANGAFVKLKQFFASF